MENFVILIDVVARKPHIKYHSSLVIKILDKTIFSKNIEIPFQGKCLIHAERPSSPIPFIINLMSLKSKKNEELTCLFQLGSQSILKIIYDEASFLGTEAMAMSENKKGSSFDLDNFIKDLECDKNENNEKKPKQIKDKKVQLKKHKNQYKKKKKKEVEKEVKKEVNSPSNKEPDRINMIEKSGDVLQQEEKKQYNDENHLEDRCSYIINKESFYRYTSESKFDYIYDILISQSLKIKSQQIELNECKDKIRKLEQRNINKLTQFQDLIHKFVHFTSNKNNQVLPENVNIKDEFLRIFSFKDRKYDDFNKKFSQYIDILKMNELAQFYDDLKNKLGTIDDNIYLILLNIIVTYMNS